MDIKGMIEIIDSAAVIEGGTGLVKQAGKDMYNGLLLTLEKWEAGNLWNEKVREEWEHDLRMGEIAWAAKEYPTDKDRVGKMHDKGPKAGQWKLSRRPIGILPNPYTSAKSVIGNAIAAGINPIGKGKSALASETKERGLVSGEDAPVVTFRKARETMFKALEEMGETTRTEEWFNTISMFNGKYL